jgi:Ni/Co efflux regulator RcnB
MSNVRKFMSIACFAASLCMVSVSGYADPGHGNGNGRGNGGDHGKNDNDDGRDRGRGHGNGHGNEDGDEHEFERKGNRHEEGRRFNNSQNQRLRSEIRFSQRDRTNIVNYFNANPYAYSQLPPGIAKNLARGKRLPPGIAKNYLPQNALSLLPNYPGYEYLVAGNKLLLVNSTTQIITDILTGLLK